MPPPAAAGATSPGRDGEEYGFHGCFHEVGEDHIVQTFTFDGQPDGVALETLRFEDLGDGRTRLHAQSLVDSFEGRDQWLASGMETGVEEGYAKLDAARRGAPMSSPADEHRRIAGAFTATVEGVAPDVVGPPRAGGGVGRPRRRPPPRRVVPRVPRGRRGDHAAGRSVGRRRPCRRVAHPDRRRAGTARRHRHRRAESTTSLTSAACRSAKRST